MTIKHQNELEYDGYFSDITSSFQKPFISKDDYEFIMSNRYLFSNFYYFINSNFSRSHYRCLHFLLYYFNYYPTVLCLCYSINSKKMIDLLISDKFPLLIREFGLENTFSKKIAKIVLYKLLSYFNFAEDLIFELIRFDDSLYDVRFDKSDNFSLISLFSFDILEATKGTIPSRKKSHILFLKDMDNAGAIEINAAIAKYLT